MSILNTTNFSQDTIDLPRGEHYKVKSWKQFFQPIVDGTKRHDMRDLKDRQYKVGDVLTLQEYNMEEGKYTGREQDVQITFLTDNRTPCAFSSAALATGFTILSLQKIGPLRVEI